VCREVCDSENRKMRRKAVLHANKEGKTSVHVYTNQKRELCMSSHLFGEPVLDLEVPRAPRQLHQALEVAHHGPQLGLCVTGGRIMI
jgi:hypothetical protein